MGGKMELTLPWPDRRLQGNARVHWRTRHHAAKLAKRLAWTLAYQAGWNKLQLPDGRITLHLTFYPPDRRKRDDDNAIFGIKSYRDGLAMALGIDDHRFHSLPSMSDEVRKGGQVVVRIEPQAALERA